MTRLGSPYEEAKIRPFPWMGEHGLWLMGIPYRSVLIADGQRAGLLRGILERFEVRVQDLRLSVVDRQETRMGSLACSRGPGSGFGR